MKTVQEIYEQESILGIEDAIFEACMEHERMHFAKPYEKNVTRLLKVRKKLLDREFVMDGQYKHLLGEFNNALTKALLTMRAQTIAAVEAVYNTQEPFDISVTGKCFLDPIYPPTHPIQGKRAEKMWEILAGGIANYMPLYEGGADEWCYSGRDPDSENQLLYQRETPDNWNEGFDQEMTKDMHLVYAVHNLFHHTEFSIFDLLWVRDFEILTEVSTYYSTSSNKYIHYVSWDEI